MFSIDSSHFDVVAFVQMTAVQTLIAIIVFIAVFLNWGVLGHPLSVLQKVSVAIFSNFV
jgi:hypothetical protein